MIRDKAGDGGDGINGVGAVVAWICRGRNGDKTDVPSR